MSSEKPTVLFIHQVDASFTRKDIEILNQFTNCITFHFQSVRSRSKVLNALHSVWLFVKQFFWLFKHRKDAKAIYCWFSDLHGFLPAVFSKFLNIPLVTVLGGFDCIDMPHLNYGLYNTRFRKKFGRFVTNNSTLLLPVNDTLIETKEIARHWPDAHPNGLKNNIKDFNTKWKAVPTGYSSQQWVMGPMERGKKVTTVAASPNYRTALRKGLDLFIKTTRELPDFNFSIVGLPESVRIELEKNFPSPPNLHFLPRQDQEGLNDIYSESSVYLQLSRAEGLPNVLCEAMMCGCVPVGSAVFGIPHGIGEAGYVVKEPDPKEVVRLIKKAHQNAEELRPKARQRIIDNFSLKKREDNVRNILQKLRIIK